MSVEFWSTEGVHVEHRNDDRVVVQGAGWLSQEEVAALVEYVLFRAGWDVDPEDNVVCVSRDPDKDGFYSAVNLLTREVESLLPGTTCEYEWARNVQATLEKDPRPGQVWQIWFEGGDRMNAVVDSSGWFLTSDSTFMPHDVFGMEKLHDA